MSNFFAIVDYDTGVILEEHIAADKCAERLQVWHDAGWADAHALPCNGTEAQHYRGATRQGDKVISTDGINTGDTVGTRGRFGAVLEINGNNVTIETKRGVVVLDVTQGIYINLRNRDPVCARCAAAKA